MISVIQQLSNEVFPEKNSAGIWYQFMRLVSSGNMGFGDSVDIDGDVMVVVAAEFTPIGFPVFSSVHVFRRYENTWIQEAKLEPGDDSDIASFGSCVSIKGNFLALADKIADQHGRLYGAVFVYELDESSHSWTLLNDAIANIDCEFEFGSRLALTNNDDLFIGCDDDAGSLYHYKLLETRDKYELKQKITDYFMYGKVAVDGGTLIVLMGVGNQKVYVYIETDDIWTEVSKIESPPDSSWLHFVAILENKAIVSSDQNAYLYSLEECP